MFKTLITCLFILSTTATFAQKTEIEIKIGNIELKRINKGVLADYDLAKNTKGKITIIEFWETWCGPCIEGMGHLRALKSKFPNTLEVICVSSEGFNKTVNFINKNNFAFTFIHDEKRLLSKLFPHSSIPHTILIDQKGQIKAQTYVSYISEQVLSGLINDKQVNLPEKKNFVAAELQNEKKTNSLLKFELLRHQLGEVNYVNESIIKDNPVQIVTGYGAKEYHDTVETITECAIAGKNALSIYQYAYNKFPKSRFIYDKKLDYLDSTLPHLLYKMNFSCSNLTGNFKQMLINQLNTAWGLKTDVIEKDCTYYELVSIDLKTDTIMATQNSTIKTTGSSSQSFKELTASNVYTAESITALIEDQIVYLQNNNFWNQADKKIYFPVTTHLTGSYTLNMSIHNESSDVDTWVKLLAKNGLKLVRKNGKVKYINIAKVAPLPVVN